MLREIALIASISLAACGHLPSPGDERPGGLLVDERGQPLAGWTVEATYLDRREHVTARQETDAAGRFPPFGIAATACVFARPPGTDGRVRRSVRPHAVHLGARALRLQVVRGTTISGTVEGDSESTPFMVHTVVHRRGRTMRRCVLASPAFSLPDLDRDDVVDLRVERPGQRPVRLTDVVAGSDVRLVVAPVYGTAAPRGSASQPWSAAQAASAAQFAATAPRSAITGVVIDYDGRPIGLAWVRFGPGPGAPQTLTNFDGEFEERWTFDGEYDVTVLVHRPGQPYDPGVPAGRVRGGTRGVVLQVQR